MYDSRILENKLCVVILDNEHELRSEIDVPLGNVPQVVQIPFLDTLINKFNFLAHQSCMLT